MTDNQNTADSPLVTAMQNTSTKQNNLQNATVNVEPIKTERNVQSTMLGQQLLPSQRRAKKTRLNAQFLPTLFDRLSDDFPSEITESPDDYVASKSQYRNIIQRDLTYLLNATNQHDLIDKDKYPHVIHSTMNYGVPSLAGGYLSESKWGDIEKRIKQAIIDFEPRLLPDTVKVTPLLKNGAHLNYNVLLFEISAMLHALPYPVEFTMQSAVDLETSRIELKPA